MADPKLGTKRQCPSCGARFYDLNKRPNECPKCGHTFEPEVLLKPRKPRAADKPKDAVAAEPVACMKDEDERDETEEDADDEAVEAEDEDEEAEPEVAEIEDEPIVEVSEDGETEEVVAPAAKRPGKAGRRGTTEEVDPDLEEFDDEEIEAGDEEDDALIPDDEEEDDLSDIGVDETPGDKEDR